MNLFKQSLLPALKEPQYNCYARTQNQASAGSYSQTVCAQQLFLAMMQPDALALVSDFLHEEQRFVEAMLPLAGIRDFVAVGDASFMYQRLLASSDIPYICVDPLAGQNIDEREAFLVRYFEGSVQEYLQRIDPVPGLCVHFTFNVASYISSLEALLHSLSCYSSLILISTWSDTAPARYLHGLYDTFLMKSQNRAHSFLKKEATVQRMVSDLPGTRLIKLTGQYCTLYALVSVEKVVP